RSRQMSAVSGQRCCELPAASADRDAPSRIPYHAPRKGGEHMRFSFWPGAGNSWADVLELGRHAEATGWDGLWYADHFMPNTADASGPTSECWTTLAAWAATVPRVRIGALVSGNTYRHPAVLANMAANVDNISGGRLVLGLGAGWQQNEHEKYGIPFYTL